MAPSQWVCGTIQNVGFCFAGAGDSSAVREEAAEIKTHRTPNIAIPETLLIAIVTVCFRGCCRVDRTAPNH